MATTAAVRRTTAAGKSAATAGAASAPAGVLPRRPPRRHRQERSLLPGRHRDKPGRDVLPRERPRMLQRRGHPADGRLCKGANLRAREVQEALDGGVPPLGSWRTSGIQAAKIRSRRHGAFVMIRRWSRGSRVDSVPRRACALDGQADAAPAGAPAARRRRRLDRDSLSVAERRAQDRPRAGAQVAKKPRTARSIRERRPASASASKATTGARATSASAARRAPRSRASAALRSTRPRAVTRARTASCIRAAIGSTAGASAARPATRSAARRAAESEKCADPGHDQCCPPRTIPCGWGLDVNCCATNEVCCKNTCRPPRTRCTTVKGKAFCAPCTPPKTKKCGNTRCTKGQSCCNGKCCSKSQKCCFYVPLLSQDGHVLRGDVLPQKARSAAATTAVPTSRSAVTRAAARRRAARDRRAGRWAHVLPGRAHDPRRRPGGLLPADRHRQERAMLPEELEQRQLCDPPCRPGYYCREGACLRIPSR